MEKVWIGTSGWSYRHWRENFYPADLKSADWLSYYAAYFSTVELNTTFYHLPLPSTIKKWEETAPEGFLYSIKASRYITHIKKLKECDESLERFYTSIEGLKEKRGPVLFQLPPSFQWNKERFQSFISLLKKDCQHVFEFRHESWFNEELYTVLADNQLALCMTDLGGKLSPEIVPGPFVYIRLHGPQKAYQGSYSPSALKKWQKKIQIWREKVPVYCYFDNDEKGYAIQDAKTLKKIITHS